MLTKVESTMNRRRNTFTSFLNLINKRFTTNRTLEKNIFLNYAGNKYFPS